MVKMIDIIGVDKSTEGIIGELPLNQLQVFLISPMQIFWYSILVFPILKIGIRFMIVMLTVKLQLIAFVISA